MLLLSSIHIHTKHFQNLFMDIMGRSLCCEKVGLKSGKWTPEEDEILVKYIQSNGEGSWKSLPKIAGLSRCGKSSRLRWINYLRGDLKRGNFSVEEDEKIVLLHNGFGNRWSMIASHLPGRTDNEIKNHWHTRLSRQSYRFSRNKNNINTSIDIANLVNQKKKRVGRVSRKLAKKYNKSGLFKSNKSPYLSTIKKSSPSATMIDTQGIDTQGNTNVEDHSSFVMKNMKESEVYDNVNSDELETNWVEFQDTEQYNIDYFLISEAMNSAGASSIYFEDQIEKCTRLTDFNVGNHKKNERTVDDRKVENLNLNSSKTMEICYESNVKDCSNFVAKNTEENQVNDNVISEELELNWLRFQGDELSNIDYFREGEAMGSNVVPIIHDEDQIEKWLSEIEVENLKKNERNTDERENEMNVEGIEDETMGFGYDGAEWDVEVDFTKFDMCDEEDGMLVSLWEDVNL